MGQEGPRHPPPPPAPPQQQGGSGCFSRGLFLQSLAAGRAIPAGKPSRAAAGLCSWAGAACGKPEPSLTFILPGLPEAGDEAGPAGLESLAVRGQAGGADLGCRETGWEPGGEGRVNHPGQKSSQPRSQGGAWGAGKAPLSAQPSRVSLAPCGAGGTAEPTAACARPFLATG